MNNAKQNAQLAVKLANEAPPRTYVRLTNKKRITDIDEKLAVNSHGITAFERSVLDTMRKQDFGSQKQQEVLNRIEIKVFGHSRDKEEAKKLLAEMKGTK